MKLKINKEQPIRIQSWRVAAVMLFILLFVIALMWRVIDLQVKHSATLQSKADARQQRTVRLNANRGVIYDRNGHVLAISAPVDSVWVNPKLILEKEAHIGQLAEALSVSKENLRKKIRRNASKTFMYVKRHMSPEDVKLLMDKKLQGVFKERQYKRYYPMGEVTSHLLGFTDIDDNGQEGLELAYEHWLQGEPGAKRVLRDRLGQVIEELDYLKPIKPGQDLYLSIDKRIQYIAYRELKKAVTKHKAKSGSVVVVDVTSGEVMALANQPSFNPNNRSELNPSAIRNRAIVDVFEPGSTMKAFSIAAALESGLYNSKTRINTAPGKLSVGKYTIKDAKNYGVLNPASILVKSSNVGTSKLVLGMPSENLWDLLKNVGFGTTTDIGYPGEQSGVLNHYDQWSNAGKAALSYGYGLATTTLQLTHAYAALANDGVQLPLTLQKQEANNTLRARRIISTGVARQVKAMLKDVVSEKGTAIRAAVPGYQVGGKTGTVKVSQAGGYAEDKYLALFAGVVPLAQPKYAVVVVINEPSAGQYYGGQVAAPVFSSIMSDTLRFMNIVPDDLTSLKARTQNAATNVKAVSPAREVGNG